MSEQITELLRELAAQLGTTAEALWNVLLAQAAIDATWYWWMFLIWACGSGVTSALAGFLLFAGFYDDDEELIVFGAFGVSLALFFGGAITATMYYWHYTMAHNPEYYALTEILEKLQ